MLLLCKVARPCRFLSFHRNQDRCTPPPPAYAGSLLTKPVRAPLLRPKMMCVLCIKSFTHTHSDTNVWITSGIASVIVVGCTSFDVARKRNTILWVLCVCLLVFFRFADDECERYFVGDRSLLSVLRHFHVPVYFMCVCVCSSTRTMVVCVYCERRAYFILRMCAPLVEGVNCGTFFVFVVYAYS